MRDRFEDGPTRSPNLWLRGAGILVAAVIVSGLAGTLRGPEAAVASGVSLGPMPEVQGLEHQLNATRDALDVERMKNTRADAISSFSTAYQIPADLAAAIYDNALNAGIDPALGFQLVKVESGFRANARSSAGAIGYTQLRLPTARTYEPWVTDSMLVDRNTNLRIGFRFLRQLIGQYHGDVRLALLAYNRGPGRINEALHYGDDPDNGYSRAVLHHRPAMPKTK
ncbi:MAG TPA: transglycosylase SLT domain-containing protein [Gemmatimonadales bacterium]|nr:transglycosylase SLT domain-containing protein [Gemmatimonadales bacterium]